MERHIRNKTRPIKVKSDDGNPPYMGSEGMLVENPVSKLSPNSEESYMKNYWSKNVG